MSCFPSPCLSFYCPIVLLCVSLPPISSQFLSLPMLCTMQNIIHCALTLAFPQWEKRLSPLVLQMLANTGSTMPNRLEY